MDPNTRTRTWSSDSSESYSDFLVSYVEDGYVELTTNGPRVSYDNGSMHRAIATGLTMLAVTDGLTLDNAKRFAELTLTVAMDEMGVLSDTAGCPLVRLSMVD